MLYRTHLGYWAVNGVIDLRQMFWESFFEFECRVWATQPMTERVLDRLEAFPGYHRESDIETYLGYSGMQRSPDVTLKTALNRLLKAGKIKRKMVEKGYMRHYEYAIQEDYATLR